MFVIATEAIEAEYIYIKNPYEKVELNRVVKEWEWVCLKVGISSFTRKESVMDKPSFRNGILYHRILIPASGFYEWNRLKEKNTFSRYDAPVLYMAGFCDWFENERRFVIMTTAANESMIKVHDRMPLILEKGQLKDWFDDRKMEQILHQVPVQLKREAEYEQQSLFL